jgi:formate dehydrogenase major subunit
MSRAGFTVAQTPFMLPPLTNLADVILPAPAWFERGGNLRTLEGERRRVEKILDPSPDLKGFDEIFETLCGKLGIQMIPPSAALDDNMFHSKISPGLAKQVQVKEA